MKISLTKAGKRFNRDWIFRNLSYEFTAGNSYAIVGPNGSGKSTLLQAIGGALMLSEGGVAVSRELEASSYKLTANSYKLEPDELYRSLAIAAPYLELIEELSVTELLTFHQQFKPFLPQVSIGEIIRIVGLEKSAHKQIRYYSSGMKQRVKLAQAIFSDVPLLLLDEPCTNLDAEGLALYLQLIKNYCQDRLVIVSSNDIAEYGFCNKQVNILDFKR
jgi:ABC-type multidrug transport system ATPase subunit